MSREIAEFIKWCKNNSLDANDSKFQSMLLPSNGKNDMSLKINDVEIEATDDMKVLEITIDHCHKFNKHKAYLCAKAGRQLNVLQRLKGYPDCSSRLTIYKTNHVKFQLLPNRWDVLEQKVLYSYRKHPKEGVTVYKSY